MSALSLRCIAALQSPRASSVLRRIKRVIRKGHVLRINASGLQLVDGDVEMPKRTVFIDCSADGLAKRPIQPIFNGERITLQTVRFCQQVFSAAFTARVELSPIEEATKNELCAKCPILITTPITLAPPLVTC